MFHGASSQRIAGRLIQPDPADPTAVAVSLHRVRHAPSYMLVKPGLEVCFMLVVNRATGAGCDPYRTLFVRSPFVFGTTMLLGGDQYAYVDGVASDAVASLRLFLGDGGVAPVPLRNNAFVILVSRARYPIRLVAYDAGGKVIGVQSSPGGRVLRWQLPDPQSPYRVLRRIRDADGKLATLYTRRSLTGGVCFAVRSHVAGATGCTPPKWQGVALAVGFLGDPRHTAVLEGTVREDVVRLSVRHRSGAIDTVRPTAGFVLEPVPHGDPIVEIDGYDAAGRRVGQFKPRLP